MPSGSRLYESKDTFVWLLRAHILKPAHPPITSCVTLDTLPSLCVFVL